MSTQIDYYGGVIRCKCVCVSVYDDVIWRERERADCCSIFYLNSIFIEVVV